MKQMTIATMSALLTLCTALPALAQAAMMGEKVMNGTAPSAMMKAGKGTALTADTLACMQGAVTKREAAIGAALAAFSTTESMALSGRSTALAASWAMKDTAERRSAIQAAWSAYKTAWKSAMNDWKGARRAAWAAFKTDVKACHASFEEPGGEKVDL